MPSYQRYRWRHSRTVGLVVVATAAVSPMTAQQSVDSTGLAFASASVKPAASASPAGQRGIRLQRGGVFSATALPLRELVEYVYQQHPAERREVTSSPAVIDSVHFE